MVIFRLKRLWLNSVFYHFPLKVTVFDVETGEDNSYCLQGSNTCHKLATCIDYRSSYCCRCTEPFTGNGIYCIDSSKTTTVISKVLDTTIHWLIQNNTKFMIPSNMVLMPLLFVSPLIKRHCEQQEGIFSATIALQYRSTKLAFDSLLVSSNLVQITSTYLFYNQMFYVQASVTLV